MKANSSWLGAAAGSASGTDSRMPRNRSSEVPHDALAGGMQAWATADSPWAHIVDRTQFAEVLAGVRRLEPTRIFSSHLPAAGGSSLDRFLDILESVPDAEPAAAPSHEEFTYMLQAMLAGAA